jgi:L-fuculose-phosphate aldolase
MTTVAAVEDRLALACRILAREGHGGGLAGQVSMRDPQAGVWTLPLGIGLEEASARHVIRIGPDLRPDGGDAEANPAMRFHFWVYEQRPDVHAIVHTHPQALSAFATLGRPLPITHMDDCVFHDDCAHLPRWPGVPVGDDEGRIISRALGRKSCVLLAGHGYLSTGIDIELATYRAVYLERAAARVLRALAVGEPQPLPADEAGQAREFLLQPAIVRAAFDYWTRLVETGTLAAAPLPA